MPAATCGFCKRPMVQGGACTAIAYAKGDDMVPVVRHDGDEACHDCSVAPGAAHHPGCDVERCGRCHMQAIGCECDLPTVVTEELVLEEVVHVDQNGEGIPAAAGQ